MGQAEAGMRSANARVNPTADRRLAATHDSAAAGPASSLAPAGIYRAMAVATDSRGHAGRGGTVRSRPRAEMVRNGTIA
jgi:hypothetical protein